MVELTDAEIAGFNTADNVAAWLQLQSAHNDPEIARGSLYVLMGYPPATHPRALGQITEAEYATTTANLKILLPAPGFGRPRPEP